MYAVRKEIVQLVTNWNIPFNFWLEYSLKNSTETNFSTFFIFIELISILLIFIFCWLINLKYFIYFYY